MPSPYRIIGIESSPYAVKVRAAFRYRRLPHVWVARNPRLFDETKDLKPVLMPVVQFPDGAYRIDSTPILLDLETAHPNGRTLLPDAPDMAFLALLIEDMADEFLTKSLFHYRFSHAADRRFAARWVIDDGAPSLDAGVLAERADAFVDRQIARMPLVGCTPENGPVFERFFRDVLTIMEDFVATDRFLFGGRPSIADFGIYGQLHTLAADPTPAALIRADAPRTLYWIWRLADASGVEGAWLAPDAPTPAPVAAFLKLAGSVYLPFLAANAAAVQAGARDVETEIYGRAYRQPAFGYQAKCLRALRERFAALPPEAAARLRPLLEEADCLARLV